LKLGDEKMSIFKEAYAKFRCHESFFHWQNLNLKIHCCIFKGLY
jgi:hypothetical protein